MAEDCDVSTIVTAFLLKTCRPKLHSRPSKRDVEAALHCATNATIHLPEYEDAGLIPLITGSSVEFYIEPMLPHVGDIDIMHHKTIQLAIPQGHPPPTQLPTEFHNYVKVHEIIDSHFPGYVYLQLRYLLTQCIDGGDYKYNYIKYDECVYLLNQISEANVETHGPAIYHNLHKSNVMSVDLVLCVRCLSWPTQAADWPTRHRNYGWPDSATLDRVVNNGCDVVPVAHRQCRQHERMGLRQWRLSFSRAEIVLINSWMPVQQIVYHMLGYFIKTERLTDCGDNSGAAVLSNYHIKTLTLWACELKSRSWWTENLNLVRICVELLQTLSVWLTDTRCPHYFINDCNLLDNSFNVGSVTSKLVSVDKEYLSTWLVNNYIRHCAQLCPDTVSRLFDDASSSVKLQNAVSEIVRRRKDSLLRDIWNTLRYAEIDILAFVSVFSLTAQSCTNLMNEFAQMDELFCVYFTAIALLHVACKMSRNGVSDKLMDIFATISLDVLWRKFNPCYSVLSLHKIECKKSEVIELMQKSVVERLTTYRQLVARDFGSVATIVTTDYESLYACKRGDYQRCLQLSTQNVHTLLYARLMPEIPTFPEFIQLMDDDIVSLTALTLIVDPESRYTHNPYSCITQLTLSLYLTTQCQLKLYHSVTSLAQTLDYIKVAQKRHLHERTLDQLTLKLIERKVHRTI